MAENTNKKNASKNILATGLAAALATGGFGTAKAATDANINNLIAAGLNSMSEQKETYLRGFHSLMKDEEIGKTKPQRPSPFSE